jgi:ketosteroid isomerase-like protein
VTAHTRIPSIIIVGLGMICLAGCPSAHTPRSTPPGVRAELERWYAENTAAYERWDVPAIMALRAPDFHAITPDGRTSDRAAMETYIVGLLNGIRRWNKLTFEIDSLTVAGDTALAVVHQHIDRMALRPDNKVHHVQTWVTQRETWIRSNGRWLMWRVDRLRDQKRVVDGRVE